MSNRSLKAIEHVEPQQPELLRAATDAYQTKAIAEAMEYDPGAANRAYLVEAALNSEDSDQINDRRGSTREGEIAPAGDDILTQMVPMNLDVDPDERPDDSNTVYAKARDNREHTEVQLADETAPPGWLADVDDTYVPIDHICGLSIEGGTYDVRAYVSQDKYYTIARFPGDHVAARAFRRSAAAQISVAKGYETEQG
jgi:hypothetical protein